MVLPQLPKVAIRALSENAVGHSRRLPHFTDSMAVGCGPSQRFVWLPWSLDKCFRDELVASLIYRHGRLVADVDGLRPSQPAVLSARRVSVHIDVHPNGSVQWARGPPRDRRNASMSWHVRVGPVANAWSTSFPRGYSAVVQGRSTISEQASWVCMVARAVECLGRRRLVSMRHCATIGKNLHKNR